MEQPIDTRLINRLEPLVQAFATAGHQRWRGQITDVSEFERLAAVQEQLADLGDDVEADADAVRDAIDAATQQAIRRIAFPFSAVALDHFGFTNDEINLRDRFRCAVMHLNKKSDRWYDNEHDEPPYLGAKPRDYVVRLVTYALAGVRDPVAYLDVTSKSSGDVAGTRSPEPGHDRRAPMQAAEPITTRGDAPRPGRPRPSGRVVAVVGAVIAAAVVGIALLDGNDSHGQRSRQPNEIAGDLRSPASSMAVSRDGRLAAGLRAVNRSYEKRWATHIRADATDRLRFALTLSNRGTRPTTPITAWVQEQQSPTVPYGHRIRVLLAVADGTVLLRSPWVQQRGWSQQLGAFQVRPNSASRSDPAGNRRRRLSFSGAPTMPSELSTAPTTPIPTGRLDGEEHAIVEFDASWPLVGPKKDGFGEVAPRFLVDGEPADRWRSSGSVHVGDRITIAVTLDNQDNYERYAHLRIRVRPRDTGRYLRLTALGTLAGTPEQTIGSAIINSSEGRPIALVAQPGSTELRVPKVTPHSPPDRCFKGGKDSKLDDGVLLGGVDVGWFGGYTFHAGCGGQEFNRQVRFKATVIAG